MAKCKECGQKAGFLDDLCESCANAQNQRIRDEHQTRLAAEQRMRDAAASKIANVARMTTTSTDLPGYRILQSLGLVRGLTIRGRGPLGRIAADFQAGVGGEVSALIKLSEESRRAATVRMWDEASKLGAHGVIAVRYDMTEIGGGVMEVLCYGTAVTVEPVVT